MPRSHCAKRGRCVILRSMEHSKWFDRTTGGDSALNASKTARPRLNNATLSRQLNKGQFTAEVVIAIARGYGQSPVEALAQTGYITSDEAVDLPRESLADLLTDQELIRALALRVDDNKEAWDDTFTEVVEEAQDDMLAARRAKKSHNRGHPRPADEDNDMPLDSVAYSGEDEDAKRDKEDRDID